MRKTIIVGSILGILFSVIGVIGIFYCEWNPAHYIDKGSLCKMASIFYWPIIPQSILVFAFAGADGTGTTLPFLIMSLITVVEFILISIVVSWTYNKLKRII